MPQTLSRNVLVHSRNHRSAEPTPGTVTQITYDRKDQVRNALKTLGIGLGITFGTVFVPILHFVLTPTCFIASFVLALDQLSIGSRSQGGTGQCPTCKKDFRIEKSKWKDRFTDTCGQCHDDLEIIPQT